MVSYSNWQYKLFLNYPICMYILIFFLLLGILYSIDKDVTIITVKN